MNAANGHWSLDKAIEINRVKLVEIVAQLVAIITACCGQSIEKATQTTLPDAVRAVIIRSLLPAESAARRLIFMLANRLKPRAASSAVSPFPFDKVDEIRNAKGKRTRTFQLFESQKTYDFGPATAASTDLRRDKNMPRISVPGFINPKFTTVATDPQKPLPSARQLCERLIALQMALKTLPKQARRMARMIARKSAANSPIAWRGTRLKIPIPTPLRLGRPPGARHRKTQPADFVLYDLDMFVRMVPT